MGYDDFFKKAKGAQTNTYPQKAGVETSKSPQTAEEALIQMLKEKQRKRRHQRKKSKKMDGVLLASFIAAFCLSCFAIGVWQPGLVDEIFDRVEVKWMGGAIAAEATGKEKSSETNEVKGESSTSVDGQQNQREMGDKRSWSTEDLSHFSKLNERKMELDRRERELSELESELHKQREEIEARILKLEEIRQKISSVLKNKVEVDEKKVMKLVDFYSNMKPKQAAEVLADINEDLAVEVLGRMKKKNAAAILNLLKAEKARTLSEKFTGYKRR